jgi:hypothetical protein
VLILIVGLCRLEMRERRAGNLDLRKTAHDWLKRRQRRTCIPLVRRKKAPTDVSIVVMVIQVQTVPGSG